MKKKRMIISFDLDGVLFVDPQEVKTEPPLNPVLMLFFPDHLREGTVRLINRLRKDDYAVWVYTSSYRSEFYIRMLFRLYRVKFDHIVNGFRHDREVQRNKKERLPAKLPNFYHIPLHIDDEESVLRHGKEYGFHVLQISGPDPQWTEKILNEAGRLRKLMKI